MWTTFVVCASVSIYLRWWVISTYMEVVIYCPSSVSWITGVLVPGVCACILLSVVLCTRIGVLVSRFTVFLVDYSLDMCCISCGLFTRYVLYFL